MDGKRVRDILLAGGGTGGHIYPLLALIEVLSDPHRTLLVTGIRPVELKILQDYPYPRIHLPWKRVSWDLKGVLRFVKDFLLSFLRTFRVFLAHRPRCVVTTAGYLGLPVGLNAFLFRSPLVLVEPNRVPGKSARILKWIARRIVALDPSWVRREVPILEGVPVRSAFLSLSSPRLEYPVRLLIVGGSQGSELFNRVLPGVFSPGDPFSIVHIIGSEQKEEVRSRYHTALQVELVPYADRIWELVGKTHLVIARAGASTVAELMASRRPAVLIPYPFAGAHQRENAFLMAECGGGVVVEEGEGFVERVRQAIFSLIEPSRYQEAVASLERFTERYDPRRIARWLDL